MAGSMSTTCRDVRPVLAECLMLGTPLPGAVAAHVAVCPECQREGAEIREVVNTLHRATGTAPAAHRPRLLASPSVLVPVAPPAKISAPPGLGDKVQTGIAQARRARTRARRQRIAIGAAALVASTTAFLVPVMAGGRNHVATTASAAGLIREGQMVPHPWGTEVPVMLTGLRPGQTYRVMTADAAGDRSPGGSVQVPGNEAVHIRIVTAMPRQAITSLLLLDQEGHVVARTPVEPPSTAA